MNEAIDRLIQEIKFDYIKMCKASSDGNRVEEGSYYADQIANFEKKVTVMAGKKYIKIIRDNGVWGFIVNTEEDKKFKYGDILRAAGWSAPARNAPRGNVFDNEYNIRWTGPEYL